MPIVAVLALGATTGDIGVLGFVQTLPFLLLSIPAGLLADRASRRGVMAGAEALRALTLAAMFIATFTGHLSIPLLAVLGFLGAVGTVAFTVAAPAIVPALVPRTELARANGQIELARSVAYASGPALAGALVAWAGGPAAFALAVALSVAALMLLLRLEEPVRAPAPSRHPLREMQDGARFVWHSDLLRPMVLAGVVWNISWFVLQTAYVSYAVRSLGLGAAAVGFTLAGYGAGMIVGAVAAQALIRRLAFGQAIQFGPAMSVLAMATMCATLLVPHPALAFASFFFFGAGPIIWTITSTTLRQTITPHAMLGRVSAIFLTANAGARPIGAALGGAVGAAFGDAACLLLAMVGFVVQALMVFAPAALRKLQTLPEPAQ